MRVKVAALLFISIGLCAKLLAERQANPPEGEKIPKTESSWFSRLKILTDWQYSCGLLNGVDVAKRRKEAELIWAKIGKNVAEAEYPDIASVIGLANLQTGNFEAAIKAFEKASVYYGPYYKNLDASRLSIVDRGSRDGKSLVRVLDKNGLPIGSGVYIWKDGLILTAAHVINEKNNLLVQDCDGKTHPVLGVFPGNQSSDLAALKTDGPSPNYLELAPGPLLKQDELRIIGFPFGSVVPISSAGRAGDVINSSVNNIQVVQCDLSSVPGYSGAPAIEPSGKMCGIVSACRTDNPYLNNRKINTYLVTYEDLKDFLVSLKGSKRFQPLGNQEWGKKCAYWSADWCKNDNLLAQALSNLKSDPEKSIELFEEAADDGSCSAWLMLGRIYLEGKACPQDLNRSFKCFSHAAELGSSIGLLMNGLSYLGGLGVEKNERKGMELIKKAADADNPNALLTLSGIWQEGKSVTKDRQLSLFFSRRAAQTMELSGMTGHISNLAKDETSEDGKKEMFEWCQVLAQTGNSQGQALLALCYLNGLGVAQDNERAIDLLKKAAAQDEPMAYCPLCVINYSGKGVRVDYDEARLWAKKAADANIDRGHLLVFLCEGLQNEKYGKQISADAIQHVEKACEMGLPDAQFFYGKCLLEGLNGIKKDFPKALKLLKQAKEKGYQEASAYIPLAQMEVDKQNTP